MVAESRSITHARHELRPAWFHGGIACSRCVHPVHACLPASRTRRGGEGTRKIKKDGQSAFMVSAHLPDSHCTGHIVQFDLVNLTGKTKPLSEPTGHKNIEY